MRKTLTISIALALLINMASFGADKPQQVNDEATAIRLAEKALVRIYGQKKIESERPLKAVLDEGVWTVSGTLHCSDGKGGTTTLCVGGVATARISQSDGRVLSTGHTK